MNKFNPNKQFGLFEHNYKTFVKGMDLLLKPIDFSVGTTPCEIIYTEDKLKLLHYIPTTGQKYPVPILIVYALVNRYYILDLQPDKSVVKTLLDAGFDVYLIDWGYPTSIDRYNTIADYVLGYLNNTVDFIRKITGSGEITLMGVCQGGTFSVMYASAYPDKVKNLVTLVTPVNFETDKGILHVWAKSMDADKIVDNYGLVPGDFLNSGFLLTDPFRLMIDKYVGLLERFDDEDTVKNFLRMEKWIFDSPDQPGETFRQFIKDFYQENLLIKNKIQLNGIKINLKNITMPLLNVMAQYDHLVPNEASLPLNDAVSSEDKSNMVFPTGHIGLFVGSKSRKEVCPGIIGWLKPRSGADTGEGAVQKPRKSGRTGKKKT